MVDLKSSNSTLIFTENRDSPRLGTDRPTTSSNTVLIPPPAQSGVFTGDYKNDGVSGEFDGLQYPYSIEMLKV